MHETYFVLNLVVNMRLVCLLSTKILIFAVVT